MKKLILLVCLMVNGVAFSQVSVFTALNSNDPAVVEQFINKNPKHPKVPDLKKKLQGMRYSSGAASPNKETVVVKKSNLTEKKLTKNIDKAKSGESGTKTAELLTHLFQNDPKAKQTLLQVVNKSRCPLVIKVSGKKFYNFNVPTKNQEYIMVDKGQYTVSTTICGANYSERKSLTANTVITLNN